MLKLYVYYWKNEVEMNIYSIWFILIQLLRLVDTGLKISTVPDADNYGSANST